MNTKLIFERGLIQLWRSDYGRHSRPSFTVVSPSGADDFPAFDDPDNGRKALDRVKELRAIAQGT